MLSMQEKHPPSILPVSSLDITPSCKSSSSSLSSSLSSSSQSLFLHHAGGASATPATTTAVKEKETQTFYCVLYPTLMHFVLIVLLLSDACIYTFCSPLLFSKWVVLTMPLYFLYYSSWIVVHNTLYMYCIYILCVLSQILISVLATKQFVETYFIVNSVFLAYITLRTLYGFWLSCLQMICILIMVLLYIAQVVPFLVFYRTSIGIFVLYVCFLTYQYKDKSFHCKLQIIEEYK